MKLLWKAIFKAPWRGLFEQLLSLLHSVYFVGGKVLIIEIVIYFYGHIMWFNWVHFIISFAQYTLCVGKYTHCWHLL